MKRNITVAGITDDVFTWRPKKKKFYDAQQPPHTKKIKMTENFFTSGYFTKKEVGSIFLHEVYHKRSSRKQKIERLHYPLIGALALIIMFFYRYGLLPYVLFGVVLLLYFSVDIPLNRREERSADKFSARRNGKENLISALEKYYDVNKDNFLFRFHIHDLYHDSKKKRLEYIASL